MKNQLASIIIALTATSALAGPTCNSPQEKWMKESDFKARLEAHGYQIKTFKISKGKCYEIYGFNKEGNRVEIYFDPVPGAVLETKSYPIILEVTEVELLMGSIRHRSQDDYYE